MFRFLKKLFTYFFYLIASRKLKILGQYLVYFLSQKRIMKLVASCWVLTLLAPNQAYFKLAKELDPIISIAFLDS